MSLGKYNMGYTSEVPVGDETWSQQLGAGEEDYMCYNNLGILCNEDTYIYMQTYGNSSYFADQHRRTCSLQPGGAYRRVDSI